LFNLVPDTYYDYLIKSFDPSSNGPATTYDRSFKTVALPDITAPDPPKNLSITDVTHESLTLNWEANSEDDLIGYNVFRSVTDTVVFVQINSGLLTQTKYYDHDLKEDTKYFYRLTALDEVPNESDFSDIIEAKTIFGPYPPQINNSVPDLVIDEDVIDNTSISLYHWFKDVNNDPLYFQCTGNVMINTEIDQTSGEVTLTPDKDWNGHETLTFYASDYADEVIDDVTIMVTGVNDIPTNPQISLPRDNIVISYGSSLTFEGTGDDVDVVYDDVLTYTWSSNISGIIGEGQELSRVFLDPGIHLITMEVKDIFGASNSTSITVTVIPMSTTDDEDPQNGIDDSIGPSDGEGNGTGPNGTDDLSPGGESNDTGQEEGFNWLLIGSVLVILVIAIIIIAFLLLRKKPSEPVAKGPVSQPPPTTPPLVQAGVPQQASMGAPPPNYGGVQPQSYTGVQQQYTGVPQQPYTSQPQPQYPPVQPIVPHEPLSQSDPEEYQHY